MNLEHEMLIICGKRLILLLTDDSANVNQSAKCQKILVIFSDGTIQNCKDVFEKRNPNKEVQVRISNIYIFTFLSVNSSKLDI